MTEGCSQFLVLGLDYFVNTEQGQRDEEDAVILAAVRLA